MPAAVSSSVASHADKDLRAAKQELVSRFMLSPQAASATATVSFAARVAPGPKPIENIVGLGIGEKVLENQLAGTLSVKVYVRKKYPLAELAKQDLIPKLIDGIPTDVEEVGVIRALQPSCSGQRRKRQRPAPSGISVGHFAITAGTIGGVARDSGIKDNQKRYILSNNHVLANCNNAQNGDTIFQPGPLDGSSSNAEKFGTLARFIPIDFKALAENTVDAAIAEIDSADILKEICSIGAVKGTITPQREMTVHKHGRTTGLTRGVVTDVDADIRVGYEEFGVAFFINTVVIRGVPPTSPFSAGGDSGSLILDSQRRACALLFAGSTLSDVTFANPIRTVLRRLKIRLL